MRPNDLDERAEEGKPAGEESLEGIELRRSELQEEIDRKRAELQEEIDRKRAELEQELAKRREEVEREIQEKTKAFSDNYNYYLSQLKLIMDMLTRSAVRVGENFLETEDADPTSLFKTEMSAGLNPELFRQTAQTGSQSETAVGQPEPVMGQAESTGEQMNPAGVEGSQADGQSEAAGVKTDQIKADKVQDSQARARKEQAASQATVVAGKGPRKGRSRAKKKRGFHPINFLMQLFNLLVAVGCILIVVLIAYFFYLTFFRSLGGTEAVFYICDRIAAWWSMICSWAGSLFP